jgi:uncharacterized protein (TIGR00369 family)
MSEAGVSRRRVVTWRDPLEGLAGARGLSGLDYLRAMLRGELPEPPIAALMDLELVEVREGHALFAVRPGEYHYNPIGTVHGGLIATVLDSAMGCAVHTLLPVGGGYTTMDLHTTYVRPITVATGRLTCEGEVIHMGGRMATAHGRLKDEAGRLYAHGITTCMIFRPPTAEDTRG